MRRKVFMGEKYSEEYTVVESDIDELNHVSNIKYVEWIQEISKAHWYSKTKGTGLDQKFFWVISSHYIEYKSSALLNDVLLIETYIEKFERAFSYRVVEVRNKATNKLLMKALTKWCLMDVETQRIARVGQDILDVWE